MTTKNFLPIFLEGEMTKEDDRGYYITVVKYR